MNFIELIKNPWPWYVAGPFIGLTVPALLILGNKSFGISSSLRHICSMCMPANIPFFNYNWRKEMWNLVFVLGVAIGGFLATYFLTNPNEIEISEATINDLKGLGLHNFSGLMPVELFSFDALLSIKGLIFFVIGGLLVGFGTRYGGGCTSGHAIMGISSLQWPSLVATCCFMLGGFFMTHLLFPIIFKLF